MIAISQPAVPRRRFRFGLRTLLVVVTLAAVGSWVYWVAWPWLMAYWQQAQFEHAMNQLKIGVTANSAWKLLPHTERKITSYTANSDHIVTGTSRVLLTNGLYFIHYRYPAGYKGTTGDAPSTSVEVFRLPLAPPGYIARRKGRIFELTPDESTHDAYEYDFLEFVNSDRSDDFGLQYELIYSDPPARPEGK